MFIALGLVFLATGFLLLINTLPKLLIGNQNQQAIKMNIVLLLAGISLVLLSVLSLSLGQEDEVNLSLGFVLATIALIVIGIGIWIAFFSPFIARNINGVKLIIVGLVLVVIAVLILTHFHFGDNFHFSTHNIHNVNIDWQDIFDHGMGPMSFGDFILLTFIFGNVISLLRRNRLSGIIRMNLILMISSCAVYWMGSSMFSNW